MTIQVINFGSNGTVNIWINGVRIINYTGDLIQSGSGMTAIDSVQFSGQSGYCMISEIIAANRDTRAFSLRTHIPNGAGDSNSWTGAYTDIDEDATSDADLIYVNTDNQDALFAVADAPSGSFNCRGIKIAARSSSPYGSVANAIKLGVKSGTIDVGDAIPLPESWETKERWAATINGSALTVSELNSMQLAFRSQANAVAEGGDMESATVVENVTVTAV
jgi:hypothetical protein